MAQRLPVPGSDDGTWGTILNDFLGVSLNADGTLQPTALTQAGGVTSVNTVTPNSSGAVTLTASNVGALSTNTKLSSLADTSAAGGAANGQVLTYNSTTNTWVPSTVSSSMVSNATGSTPGLVQLAGDLGGGTAGSATSPQVTSTHLASALPVNQGGTGSTTQNFVDLSSTQTVAGSKTFSSTIVGNISGSAASATTATTAGSASTVTTIPALTGDVTSSGSSNATTVAKIQGTSISTPSGGTTSYLNASGSWTTPSGGSASNATTSTPGLVQLAGDLGGSGTTATAPTLANTTNVQLVVNTIVNANTTVTGALQKTNNLSELTSTASTARSNISAAKTGANSDITSLTGLTTALPISEGGTGSTTQNFVDISSTQTVAGNKTLTGNTTTNSLSTTTLQVSGGSLGTGKVLTSDSSGNATWGNPGAGLSSFTSPDYSVLVGGTLSAPTVEVNDASTSKWAVQAGIVGDFSTDNGAKFNTWLNAFTGGQNTSSGEAHVNTGGIMSSVPFVIPGNCHLIGPGWSESSSLALLAGAGCDILQMEQYNSGTGAVNAFWSNVEQLHLTQYNAPVGDWHCGINSQTNPLWSSAPTDPNFDPQLRFHRLWIDSPTGEGFYGNGRSEVTLDNVWSFGPGGTGFYISADTEVVACKAQGAGTGGYMVGNIDIHLSSCHSYNNGMAPQFTTGQNWAAGAACIYSGAIWIASQALTSYSGNPSTDTTNWLAPARPFLSAGRGTQNACPEWGYGYYVFYGSGISGAAMSAGDNAAGGVYFKGLNGATWEGTIGGFNVNPKTGVANSTNPNNYAAVTFDNATGCVVNLGVAGAGPAGYLVRLLNGASGNTIYIGTDGSQAAVFSPDTTSSSIAANMVYVNGVLVSPQLLTFNQQSGSSYTFVLSDGNGSTEVQGTSASAQTFTIPANSSVAFALGTVLVVRQMGVGTITVQGAGGVTLHGGGTTTAQYTPSICFTQTSTNIWCAS